MEPSSTVKTPLRRKLTRATIATLVAMGLAVAGVMAWLNVRIADDNLTLLEQQMQETIRSKGSLLVENHALALRSLVEDNALSDIQDLVRRAVQEDSDVVYGGFESVDQVAWSYVFPEVEDSFWKRIGIDPMAADRTVPDERTVQQLGNSLFEFTMPVKAEGTAIGSIRYAVSSSRMQEALSVARARARSDLQETLYAIGLTVLAVVLLSTMLAFRVARLITEPLQSLTSTANKIASGDTNVRAAIQSGDEIEVLGSAFNQMLEAQEETFRRLEKTKQLALEASRLKDEFLANMSHEIRTPMNGVIGMVQLILGMPIDPTVRRYAEIVDASGQALLSIINDILDFSKLEAGKYELQKLSYDPRVVVQEVVELHAPRAHGKGLSILCHTRAPFPSLVEGDPDRFRQVLSNLVSNAVKFTDAGEVYVELSAETDEDGDSCMVCVTVTDTGIGISADGQAKLFKEFSQVDSSMVRRHGGTGLGLAISKRITELMGGEIRVDSELSHGSTFSFTAKVRVVDANEMVPDPIGRRALVIDRSTRWCEVLEEHMKSWGMTCKAVNTGKDALGVLQRSAEAGLAPDVIVLSLDLDDMQIRELVESIREMPAGRHIPIVILSQLGNRQRGEIEQAEFSAEITKPMRMSELYEQLVNVFTGKRMGEASEVSTSAPPVARGQKILVVDDNEINQLVAVEMLQEFGFSVDVAGNGSVGLELAKSGDYSAILMDCQMPVMDGYTAARAIRDLEQGTGKHVPIIALTAHAMAGERERVRRAGMDDYLSKPARPRLLLKLLNHFLHEQADDAASEPAMKAENGASELDPNTRRSEALIRLCLKLVPGQMESVRAAVAKGDCPEVRAAAHKLKGGALSMAAGPMSRLAERLQHNAERGDLSSAPQLLHDLEVSYKRVERQLRRELKALIPQDKPEESQLA